MGKQQTQNKFRHRFFEILKMVFGYVFIIGGPLLYQILSANLPIPSVSEIQMLIRKNQPML